MRRVLGIDPGSAATGWALLAGDGRRASEVASGVVRPRGKGRSSRLADLDRRLEELLAELAPEEVAVESPFTARNPRSALALAEARGVVLAAVGRRGLACRAYAPAEVKRSVVGTGRAEKAQVAFMVTRLLGLTETPPEDAADAMAVALTHLRVAAFSEAVGLA